MEKGGDERIDEGVLHWFSHVEKMENDRIAKSLYIGGASRGRKRGIDTVKSC